VPEQYLQHMRTARDHDRALKALGSKREDEEPPSHGVNHHSWLACKIPASRCRSDRSLLALSILALHDESMFNEATVEYWEQRCLGQ